VHHITPLESDIGGAFERGNLAALCARCHHEAGRRGSDAVYAAMEALAGAGAEPWHAERMRRRGL
tara:strand:- start:1120 stop:1314 length:195 start_codon:yes stop_codon:yes gene_type:complete